MNRVLFLFAAVSILLISSCKNDNNQFPIPVSEEFVDLNIANDFKFETTRSIVLNLEIESSQINEPVHKFYIYIGNPNEGGKLISSGITDAYSSYQTKLKIPTSVTQLHIRKQDVNGNIETLTVDASGSSISHVFTVSKSTVVRNFKSTNNDDDPGCDNCDHVISGNHNNLTLNGDSYCVVSGTSLTVNNLKLKNGAQLVVCGIATISKITPNGQHGGSVYVSTGGILYNTTLNTNKLSAFVNYGITYISNNLNIHQTSKVVNYNIMNISGSVNNNSDEFINNGKMQISGHFNNNEVVYNYDEMTVSGHLNNNGNPDVEFYNYCKLIATGDFNQNRYFFNSGYVSVGQNTRLTGNSTTIMEPQAFITTNTITINSLLQGPSVPCARINVATTTNISGSGEISGYLDLCDADGIENQNGTIGDDVTFDCSCYIAQSNCNPGAGEPSNPDEDGDGCPDDMDDYPTDPERCSNEYYPNEGDFTNLAFEDLWSGLGDYDFNDLIVETNYKIVKNAQNNIVEVFGKFHIAAVGADLNNGFAIEFDVPSVSFESVSGNEIHGSAVTISNNGVENGPLNKGVVVVYDAITNYLNTSMVNTIPGGNYMAIDTINVHMKFVAPQENIGTPPYNPFMFINQTRGKEVHLIDHAPSELVDDSYFGLDADNSIPAQGRYYVTENNLPWVIEVPVSFAYPIEKADILDAHLKFREWAESSGELFPDWYENKSGYRNDANIYEKPE
jgi:LruC domain-containing protein